MRNETWLRMLSGFVLVGVFAAGALFGAGLLRWTQRAPDRLPPPPPPPMMAGGGPVEKMHEVLALDDAQTQALHDIMQKHRPELDAIMHGTQAKVRDVLFSIENDLVPQLRPDQVKKLEQWRATRPPPPMPGFDGPPGGPPGGRPPFPPPPGGGPP